MIKTFIDINDSRWKKYKIDFNKIVEAVFSELKKKNKNSEISIVLTNDSEICQLNKKYRGIDKPTNVLSFETGDSELLGDIYISFDTTMRESGDPEFISHTTHLIVHGVLHLLGYDHCSDSGARTMEALEIKILAKLGIKNPYDEKARGNFASIILCALFGAVASFGFAPFNLWLLTIIGIGAAYWLISKKQNILLPVAFGAAYAVVSFWWVLNSIYVVPELAAQFAIWTVPGLIGIAIGGALIFSLPFIITTICMRRLRLSAAVQPFVFAASWTFVLWLREWFLTGFPWNPIANITLPFPPLANSMSLWGALGLTFIIMGFIASIAQGLAEHLMPKGHVKQTGHRLPFMIFVPLLLIGIGYGYYNIRIVNQQAELLPVIRIVQPAQSAEQKATHSREQAIANAEKNIETLISLASDEQKPDLIIFPETAYPFTIVQDRDDFPMAKKLGVPTIIGAMSFDNGRFYNSMVVADAEGKIEKIYSKSHLVPFGEYRPFGDLVPTPGQLTPGQGPEIIEAQLRFAPAVCYEIIFTDSLVPHKTQPQAIINITNDTWFGKTPGTFQHLDMTRRQAIESGLPVIRANYSGISAFISADGRVISSLPIGIAGTLDGKVFGAHMTPYRKIGRDLWMAIILAFSVLCIFTLGKKYKQD
ncbi:MAG: apolipoprotein N-acyltransferase [Alphaproteobacteria bacterium]|nr:apolipoprotein N-acyltransferase [Alphaproteobacteria bacterium]